jgi:hypothetical protein
MRIVVLVKKVPDTCGDRKLKLETPLGCSLDERNLFDEIG